MFFHAIGLTTSKCGLDATSPSLTFLGTLKYVLDATLRTLLTTFKCVLDDLLRTLKCVLDATLLSL